jgi:uncharacterized protein YjbI with pentapeptide repeats
MQRTPLLAAALALVLAAPAAAQNAGQIQRAAGGASCPGCNLFQADFASKELKARNFSRARLRQASFASAVMNRTSFAGADLRDVDAYAGVFSSASFAGADLTNATFVGAYLQGANFRGAKLEGTNFSGAEMDRAVGLTQAQLASACGDPATTLPRGLSLKPCR